MPRPLSIREIQDAVARHYDITVSEMLTYGPRKYVRPRRVAMFIARSMTDHPVARIAHFFGYDDETVRQAAKKIARTMETDAMLAGAVISIRAELEAATAP